MTYGISKTTSLSFTAAIEKTTEELRKEGFGILTTIDVRETMKKKLDVEFGNYTILGACNPPFAFRALQAEERVGLLLPCNVIVYEKNGSTIVSMFDPMTISAVTENPDLLSIAQEIKQKLTRVLQAV
ncbi:MAG: DUF302 domain-containing protein [Ignavibacteriales bacterium]|nr:DUF302 domain-containing protein [Ignavibacteriales bacterium]